MSVLAWAGVAVGLVGVVSGFDGADDYDYVVDPDGNGDYGSVQAAIDGAQSFPADRITILLREGVYDEKVTVHAWNPRIALIGESREGTIITHGDHFDGIDRGPNSTFFTYTMRVQGNDFRARNLTVRNDAGRVGQAVAFHVEATRAKLENCRFVGNQDTLYAAGEGARQYFEGCHVEGTTDFVFGNATAVFEGCRLHSKANSYVTAAATPESEPFGYVFSDCTLTAEPDVTEAYLGRPWRDHARTAFVRSYMGAHVHPAGWHNWSRPEAESTVEYAEYDSRGPGAADADERAAWSRELTASEAADYAKENVLVEREPRRSEPRWYETP